jgi:hypothetical protein
LFSIGSHGDQAAKGKLGIGGDVLHYAADEQVVRIIRAKYLADRVCVAKEFFGHGFCEYDAVGVDQGGMRIPVQHLPTEDVKGRGIHEEKAILLDTALAMLQEDTDRAHEPNDLFDLGKVVLECGPDGCAAPDPEVLRGGRTGVLAFLNTSEGLGHAIDPVCFGMVLVVGQFVQDVERDQQTAGHPDRQAGDIDKGKEFSFLQVAPGDLEEVTEHKVCIALAGDKTCAGQERGSRQEIGVGQLFGIGQWVYGFDTYLSEG